MYQIRIILLVLISFNFKKSLTSTYEPLYERQQFQPLDSPAKPKQTIQQFQLALVLPPGTKPPHNPQPPSSSSPEYVWVQIPASYLPGHQSPGGSPDQIQTLRPPSADSYPPIPPSPAIQQPVTSTTTQNTPVDVLLKKCLTPRGQFPSDSCNKYVNCWDGVAVEQFCPEGLVFNSKGYCDYPYNVNCGSRPVEVIPPPETPTSTTVAPGQTSSPITQPTTIAPPTVIVTLPTIDPTLRKLCLKPRGQFRSRSCNKFVNCWDDIVIEQECPEGLLFSNKGYCDYAANVDCTNQTAPSRNGDEISSECLAEFGTFRDKTNCSNYFTCIAGQVVARYSCPEGFNFNDNIGVCDWANRVDCSKDPLIFNPKSNFMSNIPKDFMQKIENCKPGSVISLNQQCTTACICHEGVSEVVQCPAGLAYDIKTDKCLLPYLAKC